MNQKTIPTWGLDTHEQKKKDHGAKRGAISFVLYLSRTDAVVLILC